MRVLLLSYVFPPNSAVGALRWESLAALAAERGWTVDVLALDPADVPNPDMARLRALPPGVTFHGVRFREGALDRFTRSAWSLVRRLQGRGAIPRTVDWRSGQAAATTAKEPVNALKPPLRGTLLHDTRDAAKRAYNAVVHTYFVQPWAQDAARKASCIAGEHMIDVVVSSGPPHMVHRAGRSIAKSLGIPHVVDMRDPWSLVERLPDDFASPLWYALSRMYEGPVIRDAALVVSNTAAATEALSRRYPDAAARMLTVMNGADDLDMSPPRRRARFEIAFAGSIYLDRDPRLFFRALKEVVDREVIDPDSLRVLFIGNVSQYGGLRLHDVAAEEGVEEYLDVEGFLPRQQVLARLAEATMLLSLPQDSHAAVPAKIFEYTNFDAWLLVLASRGSATEQLLRHSDASVIEPSDVPGMAAAIKRAYELFRAGERPLAINSDGRFSRRRQAGILFSAIEALVHRTAGSATG